MATHTISVDRTNGVDVNSNNEKWIVNAGVSLDVAGDNAFFCTQGFIKPTIDIFGSVHTTGVIASLLLQGNHSAVIVESGGSIDSTRNAISISGRFGEVTNDGSITAVDFGVRMRGEDGIVTNTGTIASEGTCVDFSGANGELQNFGSISGPVGVSVHANSKAFTLENHATGSISGTKYAYVGDSTRETLINEGTIDGKVILRSGADVFISNGGTVTGRVFGGNGNDTYVIDNASIELSEFDGGGTDSVRSNVSYTLASFIENLRLTGTGTTDGTGNVLSNLLRGNLEANHLFGLKGNDRIAGGGGQDELDGGAGRDRLIGGNGLDLLTGNVGGDTMVGGRGSDTLIGGRGNDHLSGGAGPDTFVFANKHGIDTIDDFVAKGPSHDILDLTSLTTINSFRELKHGHLAQDGADVVITDGHSKIILEDVQISQLTRHDFLF
jgi:Ca2+-binding RTX toxin-like protein